MTASVQPWRKLSVEFLDKHEISTPSRAEGRVGPVEGLASNEVLDAFRACRPEDAAGLTELLRDPLQRCFVKLLIFATESVPQALLRETLLAGVHTDCPSFNNHYLLPCAILYGRRVVLGHLLDLFAVGTNREKWGVAGAMYWCSMPREHMMWPHHVRHPIPRPPPDEPIDDLVKTFEELALEEFIRNDALDVRRALVVYVPRARTRQPALVDEAVAIARACGDEYINQRLLCDLGESRLIPCKPRPGT